MTIYLDYNATHPPNEAAIEAAQQEYFDLFANASGRSAFSQRAHRRIEQARTKLSSIFDVDAKRIVFTASATEANAIAIWSLSRSLKADETHGIALSASEHPSVTENVNRLGVARHEVELESSGRVDFESLERAMFEAKFGCVQWVSNETGVVQDLEQIQQSARDCGKPIVCDAVQALAKLRIDTKHSPRLLAKDSPLYYTFAGHKIGAGFGTGMLILPSSNAAKTIADNNTMRGGSQEQEVRPGSSNLQSIVAFEKCVEELVANRASIQMIEENTNTFETDVRQVLQDVPGSFIVGGERLPGTTMLCLPGVDIDVLLMALDQAGITLSTGTSCKSRSRTASAGLLSMGLSSEQALSVLRFSYADDFTADQQKEVLRIVSETIEKLVNNLQAT